MRKSNKKWCKGVLVQKVSYDVALHIFLSFISLKAGDGENWIKEYACVNFSKKTFFCDKLSLNEMMALVENSFIFSWKVSSQVKEGWNRQKISMM